MLFIAATLSGGCHIATITITPPSLSLLPGQYDTGGSVNITCQASGLQTGEELLVMNITRTVGGTDTVLASASKFHKRPFLVPNSYLTSASTAGVIREGSSPSTMTLTLPHARCNHDEGRYTCKIRIQTDFSTYNAYDHKNLIITG